MTEHGRLEAIAVEHDEKADDLFGRIANGEFTAEGAVDATIEAQAQRRVAEIIRHQLECEA